jgi:hypothetical protein
MVMLPLLLLSSLRASHVVTVPPPVLCPWPAVAAAVSATGGRLSVKLFNQSYQTQVHGATSTTGGSSGTGTSGTGGDDGPAIRWAINASHLCGGVVFFPQGQYTINGTIDVPSDTTFLG